MKRKKKIKKSTHIRNDYLVLKNKFSNICKDNLVHNIINDACIRSNTIVRHSYIFIRYYFSHLFASNKSFPLIDKKFMRDIMALVSSLKKHDKGSYVTNDSKELKTFYDSYFVNLKFSKVNRDNLSQLLSYEIVNMISNIETGIRETFKHKFNRYINILLNYEEKQNKIKESKLTSLEKKEKQNKLRSYIYEIKQNILFCSDTLEKDPFVINQRKILFPFQIHKNGALYDVKIEPQKYLHTLFTILQTYEKINKITEIKNKISDCFLSINKTYNKTLTSITCKRKIKLFNVTPLRSSLIPGYITIDSLTLIQLFGETLQNKVKSDYFGSDFKNVEDLRKGFNNPETKYKLWSVIFNLNDKFFSKKGNYSFEYLLSTDAFACSATFTHRDIERTRIGKPKSFSVQRRTDICNYIEDAIQNNINIKEVVCIDPNKRNIMFCGKYDNDKLTTLCYTLCQRKKETKTKKYHKYRKRLQENHKINHIEDYKSGLNIKSITNKNVGTELFKYEIANQRLKKHYTNETYRKLKWFSYLNKKKSESKFMKNFKKKMGSNSKVDVVIGDYSINSSNMKGTESVISSQIVKLFQKYNYNTYVIDEYNTSKLCHCCNKVLEPYKIRKSVKPKTKGTMMLVHGLLRHKSVTLQSKTNQDCSKIHNRDKNAVSNMLKIVKHLLKHKIKPSNFCYENVFS